MPSGDELLGPPLRLARDLCFGVGAFVVSPGGTLRTELLPEAMVPSLAARVRALALTCLDRAAGQDEGVFWTTEPAEEAGTHTDSLACVAMALHDQSGLVGLLGVVDGWLPELDEEQQRGLASIATTVTPVVAALAAEEAVAALAAEEAAPRPVVSGPGDSGLRDVPSGSPEPADRRLAPAPRDLPRPGPDPAEPTHPPVIPEWVASAPSAGPAGWVSGGDQFLAEVVDHHPDGLVVVLEDGTILFANQTLVAMSGLPADEMVGADIGGLVMSDADQPLVSDEPAGALVGVGAPGRRLWLSSASGADLAVEVVGSPFASPSAASTCFVAAVRLTPAGQGTGFPALDPERVAQSSMGPVIPNEGALNALLNALEEGIVVCDHDGVVLVANLASKVLQGISPVTELVGRPFPVATALRASDGSPLPAADHPVIRAMGGTVVDAEQLVIERTEGERRYLVASSRPFLLPDGNGALMVLRDVTAQHKDEEWLTHLALHDALTGLANRYLLVDHLGRMLSDVRARGGSLALVYLDLDDFKNVNDRYGHDVGDEVLVALGRRLEGTVRSTDICARIGGDEFVIAHTATSDPEDIELVVSRIRKTLAEPYRVRGDVLYVGASIGWVTADPQVDDPKSLLVQADQEMYRHKNARRRAES